MYSTIRKKYIMGGYLMVIAASAIGDFFGTAVYPGSYCCKNKNHHMYPSLMISEGDLFNSIYKH